MGNKGKLMITDQETSGDASTDESPSSNSVAAMAVTPWTLAGYLVGRREDILAVAACPGILWIGGLLVLSAGLAREYDGEDLLHEPWHLVIPHVASLVTSVILYSLLRLPAVRSKSAFSTFIREYPVFLALFWLTAPLAWIYAIPFERWMTPGAATQINLIMLGIVSLWRVLLITRIVSVVYKAEVGWRVLITVLAFGDAVMLAAVHFVPVPIFQLMGGIRLTESESVMLTTTCFLQLAGYPMLFLLAIGYLCALPPTPLITDAISRSPSTVGRSTWGTVTFAVVVWIFVLPYTQPEQRLRGKVEGAISDGRIAEALHLMSAHQPGDFPPHWTPPPHVALTNQKVDITDVMQVVLNEHPAAWVRDIYVESFCRKLPDAISWYRRPEEAELLSYLRILSRLPVEDWNDDESWQMTNVGDVLREMASDKDRDFSDETVALLTGIVDSLPAKPNIDIAPAQDTGEHTEAVEEPKADGVLEDLQALPETG